MDPTPAAELSPDSRDVAGAELLLNCQKTKAGAIERRPRLGFKGRSLPLQCFY
jgi:hypothetical protein